MSSATFFEDLSKHLRPAQLRRNSDTFASYLEDSRGAYQGQPCALVLPESTEQVAAIVRVCANHQVPIVPQGGNTSRCGGSVPDASGSALLLNLGRMDAIRELDKANYTMTVEAGAVLADIQQAAAAQQRLFPLRLGAQQSCQIGGNLATNAGGYNALRYGNARELTLGLEVVLADGQVLNALTALRKNNTGYDLRDLFIGSEGTLGIITAAVLRLFPIPQQTVTAWVGVETLDNALQLLEAAREASADQLTACEVISRFGVDIALANIESCVSPLGDTHKWPWYVLLEGDSSAPGEHLQQALESVLANGISAGWVGDAVLAHSPQKARQLWQLREGVVTAQRLVGASIKHDIAVPVSAVPEFVRQALPVAERIVPGIRPCPFGHLGDGNLHFNFTQPAGMEADTFRGFANQLNAAIHDLVLNFNGSFAAEHGVGRLKKDELSQRADPAALDLMHRVKRAFDPMTLFNPDVLL